MRIRSVLAAGLTVVASALLAVTLLPDAGAAAPAPAAASYAHPYSSPIWYPLHDGQAQLDCVHNNPGCPADHQHADQSMTLLTKTKPVPGTPSKYYHAPVYPAGAGVVHIGHSGITSCPGPSNEPLGNWVWIDHGAGISTRYAHLNDIDVTEGEYVTLTTVLGHTGNTGESAAQCYIYYLNYQLRNNSLGNGLATGYPLSTSRNCAHNVDTVTFPTYLNPAWKTWNQTPKDTWLPRGLHGCVPTRAPNTPSQPATPTVTGAGTGKLTVHWTKPSGGPTVTRVCVELQTSGGTFVDPLFPKVEEGSTFTTTYTFSGLHSHSGYRARVLFFGSEGWSRNSDWRSATAP